MSTYITRSTQTCTRKQSVRNIRATDRSNLCSLLLPNLDSLSSITMRFTATLLPLLVSSLATCFSFLANDQQILDDDLKVPGDNPLKFCANSDDFILTINKVDLEPNPPSP